MEKIKGRSPPPGRQPTAERNRRSYFKVSCIAQVVNRIIEHQKIEIMKTTIINSKGQNENGTKANENGISPKVNGLPVSNAFNAEKKEEAKKQETASEVKTVEQPKPKAEAKIVPELTKPALNLEGTLKLVEELHRRKIQRDKLIDTIDTLEAFEVSQKDDAEETDSNHFQGCVLSIEDDKRREFITKNPFIIKKVAEYINALCMDRLAEIEGEIQLPA